MSAAGEQYLDFRPVGDGGPLLVDGSTVREDQTTVPISFAQLLLHTDGALAQIDPQKLSAITDELRVGSQGPQKLAALLDGGALLVTALDSVLPQTVSAIRNSRVVFTTLADMTPGLRHTSHDLQQILRGATKLDGGYRTLVDRGSEPLTALDHVIADNSATMVQLLGNLTTIAQLSYLRVPALKALFPTYRGSAIEAMTSAVHEDAVWIIADIYPRYTCDYNLPRRPPWLADFPEPYLNTYCPNPDPALLVRGARNAPRPPGDDTAGAPPGLNPVATTDPTPVGPHSIPITLGGPIFPQEPPP
jgi:hypothetical protein